MDGKSSSSRRKQKQKKQARKKKVVVIDHPLDKLISNPYSYGTYIHNSCVTKLWKTTPRLCSPTLVPPWLVLRQPHPDILGGEWSRYWWSLHHTSWISPCSCCPKGTRQGPELTWTKEESKLQDPNSPHLKDPLTAQFTNAIMVGNKVYALSLHGTLATLDLSSPPPRLRVLKVRRPLPSTLSTGPGFRECLLESCGQLMLLFLISTKSMALVSHVEVYRLDGESWVKMASLGDTALFATHTHCGSVSASKFGCRGNCVYFRQVREGGWWVFHMEDGTISPAHAHHHHDMNTYSKSFSSLDL